jgi:uncharacterized phage protein (TIGR02218 family)
VSYDIIETSRDDGRPVELYEWTLGAEVWRYTSADTDQAYAGEVYTAAPISRAEIEEVSEINRANLKISVAVTHPVALLFQSGAPHAVLMFRLFRTHRGDAEGIVLYLGRVVNCEWSGREAVLMAEPIYTSIRQPGLRRAYSRFCTHALYGPACRLDKADWAMTGSVLTISGTALTINGPAAALSNYLTGGWVEWTDGAGYVHRQMIDFHAIQSVGMMRPIPGLAVGQTVSLYPGCDHTLKACREKFENRENYGGFKWIPTVNPVTSGVF